MTRYSRAFPATYLQTVATGMKSRWTVVILLLPVTVFLAYLTVETRLTELIIPLFPPESDKSFGFYRDFLRLCFNEMLWWSFFLLLAWVFVFQLSVVPLAMKLEKGLLSRETRVLGTLMGVVMIFSLSVAVLTLDTFANSADEYVYLYQAETLAEGKLVEEAHPLGEYFLFNHIAQKDGVAVGRFPPGWPLLLSIAYVLNFPPYWVNPVLGGLALLLFFAFTKRYYGQAVALWSTLSLALTGYYLFNAASYFSHTSCLLFTVGFVYAIYCSTEKASAAIFPLLAGACLGMIVLIRSFNAVLLFVPFALCLIFNLKTKSIRPLFFIGVGAAPFVLFLLWYNQSITGNPLLPVTMWVDQTETIGFVKGHTVTRAVEYSIRRLLLFLYWCSPSILILYGYYLIRKMSAKVERFTNPEDYYLLLLLAGYFFYHHLGGNQYGPRFLFEGLPFAIVLVVRSALRTKSQAAMALLAAGLIYAVVKLPYIMRREHQVVTERTDIYAAVEKAGIQNAVIMMTTHTGIIRPMPVHDLTRNHSDYRASVLYAEALQDNTPLMSYYPDRKFYLYKRDPEKVEGWFVEVPHAGVEENVLERSAGQP